MPGVSHENLRWALMITVALLAIFVVRQALYAWLRRRRIVHRITRARRGESRARELLEMRGYCVIAAQFVCSYRLSIDGEDLTIPLRADYLVSRDGVRYVAEVKTGAYAPHLRTPATRRQLLEYRMAFEVDGVLLVDAEQERIHVVRFPFFERAAAEPALRFGWLVIAVGVAVLIAAQWR
ncbi:MAG TPA: hypothetical protein VK550_28570 [Polyangiaceae bacterium]|nr:hypothetical protein [Polyangiaceae bacterium]